VGVSADVISRCSESEEHQMLGSRVDELAARICTDPHETIRAKQMLDSLYQQGQLTFEHQVDLLLLLMRMYAASLARLKHDQIDAKATHIELASQRLKTLTDATIERCERDISFSHDPSLGALLDSTTCRLGCQLLE
jgi:hypothetical protein